MTPFRRDGHLSDVGIDHAIAGETLPGTACHLEGCLTCHRRLDAARRFQGPLTGVHGAWGFGGLAVAATLLFFLMPASSQVDGIRTKGSGLHLEVFEDLGGRSRLLRSGDEVSPGDRLGFRVRHGSGHLMILGFDSADSPYLCYPQRQQGLSRAVEARVEARGLPEAIRLDNTKGTERIVAVLCDRAFDFDSMAPELSSGGLPVGCLVHDIELEKP